MLKSLFGFYLILFGILFALEKFACFKSCILGAKKSSPHSNYFNQALKIYFGNFRFLFIFLGFYSAERLKKRTAPDWAKGPAEPGRPARSRRLLRRAAARLGCPSRGRRRRPRAFPSSRPSPSPDPPRAAPDPPVSFFSGEDPARSASPRSPCKL